MLIVKGLITI